MKVLVSGGRNYNDRKRMYEVLDRVHEGSTITHIITGAGTGADELAEQWAKKNQIKYTGYPAQWDWLGKSAGPIRNQRMIDDAKPDLAVVFPGNRGTGDLYRRVQQYGCMVSHIQEDS